VSEESTTLKTSPDAVLAAPGVPVMHPVEALSVAQDGKVPDVRENVYGWTPAVTERHAVCGPNPLP
jgi:hypothetical protein